jgi:hypothetical protein
LSLEQVKRGCGDEECFTYQQDAVLKLANHGGGMTRSQDIIRDLFSGDGEFSDPSGLLPDLQDAFAENQWTRDRIKEIADEHRTNIAAIDNAT